MREPLKCKFKRTIRGKLVAVKKREVDDSVGDLTPLKLHLKSKGFMVVQEDWSMTSDAAPPKSSITNIYSILSDEDYVKLLQMISEHRQPKISNLPQTLLWAAVKNKGSAFNYQKEGQE